MPAMKTIESFTEPEDRNPFSYVMQRHQKCSGGYAKMMTYLTEYFRYPTSLPLFVYASQLMQAQAMRYAVEHWRRFRGRCMGAIVWQLNDCWPVASWSSIDYFGRWKALHYFEKRFFAPVLLSCCEEGMLTQGWNVNARGPAPKKSIQLNVSNETRAEKRLTVRWSLRDSRSPRAGNAQRRRDGCAPLRRVAGKAGAVRRRTSAATTCGLSFWKTARSFRRAAPSSARRRSIRIREPGALRPRRGG